MTTPLTFLGRTTMAVASATILATGARGQPATMPQNNSSAAAGRVATAARYRDGTYTATGWYGGLPSRLTVTVRLAGDILRDVSVRTHATDPTSLDYQRRFAAAVPGVTTGKRIDEVRVGKLAGSSGCPDGFNDAIRKIRQQAGHSTDRSAT